MVWAGELLMERLWYINPLPGVMATTAVRAAGSRLSLIIIPASASGLTDDWFKSWTVICAFVAHNLYRKWKPSFVPPMPAPPPRTIHKELELVDAPSTTLP